MTALDSQSKAEQCTLHEATEFTLSESACAWGCYGAVDMIERLRGVI